MTSFHKSVSLRRKKTKKKRRTPLYPNWSNSCWSGVARGNQWTISRRNLSGSCIAYSLRLRRK